MSLSFYLTKPGAPHECECKCGHIHTAIPCDYEGSFNITHNLNTMAQAAGIYECLWRPDEQVPPILKAGQCIEPLRAGLAALRSDPSQFRQMSAEGGWGTYEQFVPWVAKVLEACEANPDADVYASS